jgi:hypothetical protein
MATVRWERVEILCYAERVGGFDDLVTCNDGCSMQLISVLPAQR